MILDAMTYSAMTVVATVIFVVIFLAWNPQGRRDNSGKSEHCN